MARYSNDFDNENIPVLGGLVENIDVLCQKSIAHNQFIRKYHNKTISEDTSSLMIRNNEIKIYYNKFIVLFVPRSNVFFIHIASPDIISAKKIRADYLPDTNDILDYIKFEIWTPEYDIVGRDKFGDYEDIISLKKEKIISSIAPLNVFMNLPITADIACTFYYFIDFLEAIKALEYLQSMKIEKKSSKNIITAELFENIGGNANFQSKYVLIISKSGEWIQTPEIPNYHYIKDFFSSEQADSFRLLNRLITGHYL